MVALLTCWFKSTKSSEYLGGSFNFIQFSGITVFLNGCMPPCGTTISRPGDSKTVQLGRRCFAIGSLGAIVSHTAPVSVSWFPDSLILAMEETVSYIGYRIRAYVASWIILPHTWNMLSPSWYCNWLFKNPFCHYIKPSISGWWGTW